MCTPALVLFIFFVVWMAGLLNCRVNENHHLMGVVYTFLCLMIGLSVRGAKRFKPSSDAQNFGSPKSSPAVKNDLKEKNSSTSEHVLDYSSPHGIPNMLEKLESGRYGSVTEEIRALIDYKMQLFGPYFARKALDANPHKCVSELSDHRSTSDLSGQPVRNNIVDVQKDCKAVNGPSKPLEVVILSDDEEEGNKPCFPFQQVVLQPPAGKSLSTDIEVCCLDNLTIELVIGFIAVQNVNLKF